jgi:conjugal transfer ATP-binding protein TraC
MIPELLPYHSYDPDGRIFVQNDGSLGLAWGLAPLECETLPEAALGQIARRIESLLALFPEGSAAQFLLASARPPDLSGWLNATTEGGLLRDLAESRVRATGSFEMRHEGAVFAARSTGLTLTLRVFPSWHAPSIGEGLRFVLAGDRTIEGKFRRAYGREKSSLLERAEAVENLLAQAGVAFRRLDLDGFRRLVHAALNPGRPAPPPPDDGEGLLRERLAFEHLEIDGATIRLGGVAHHLLSMRESPRETWAGMLPLDSALEGSLVLNIEVCRAAEVRKFLAAKKRLAFCQLSGGDDKVDVSAMKREADQVAAEIFTEGARVYSVRLHAVPRAAPEGTVNAFSRLGIEMVQETGLAPSLFLQSLPLAYDPANDRALKRGRRMLGLNLAHLVPLYGALRGTPTPDLLLLNRRGEPATFSFFDSTVAPHGIVAGVSGSGKSVLANTLILSAARRGARVFVLDRGHSYRKLCETLGGTYVAFDPRAPLSINPCGRELDDEKKGFLADILCEMCGQGQRDLGAKERGLISRAIARAFARAGGREVLARDILEALEADGEPAARDLAICMELFARDGPYAGFFDRPCALEDRGPLTVYELGDAAKRRDAGSVILMALIHRITEFARSRLDVQKYLVVDEAWTLLKSATTAQFLEDVLRTYRKLNAAAIMVTQQVTDFEGRAGEAIRANAPNRLFLQQTPETILAMQKVLDLSPEEKALLGQVRTVKGRFSEMLVLSTETRGVARLVPDALSYWISTTDPKDNLRLEALVRERGDLRSALLEAARA